MSATLFWRPKDIGRKELADELRFILQESVLSGGPGQAVLGVVDRPYLKGLHDAHVKDADILIEAIERHGEIEIWLAY